MKQKLIIFFLYTIIAHSLVSCDSDLSNNQGGTNEKEITKGGPSLFKNDSGNYGYKGKDGRIILKPKYKYARPFSEGLAYVETVNSKGFFIDIEGKTVISSEDILKGNSSITGYRKDYVIYDFKDGRVRIKWKNFSPLPYPYGTLLSEKYGFINKKGQYIAFPSFHGARDFSESMAAVQIEKDGKWGFINKEGEIAIEPQYIIVSDFSEGVAFVLKEDEIFLIDKNNRKNKQIDIKSIINKKMTNNGDTPFLLTIYTRKFKPIEFLLSKGANPNMTNKLGTNPLFYLVVYNEKIEYDIVSLLLEHGANPNLMPKGENEPILDYLYRYRRIPHKYDPSEIERLIKLLRKHGAKTAEELEAEKAKQPERSK